MPSIEVLPVFVVASLALLVVPGPAVLYIVARSGAQGQRAGIVSVLGVHTGSLLHVVAAVAGLSAIVMTSSVAFTAIKVVGGAYLVYLGVKTLLGAGSIDVAVPTLDKPLRRLYLDGLVVNLLNPKVALFFLAFLPQFVSRSDGPMWSQTFVFGLLYIALGLVSDGTYAFIGARAGGWLRRRAAVRRRGKYVEGGVLIGLGITALAAPHHQPAQ
jgi:threonine/homoserine/homoserine lactone efflux protein